MYTAIHIPGADGKLGLSLCLGTLPLVTFEEALLGKEERWDG